MSENMDQQATDVSTDTTTTPAVETVKTAPQMIPIYGRQFDVSTEEGRTHLRLWAEAHESARGSLANEVGQLRKEVEPLRKYNLKDATLDEVSIATKVDQYRAEGNHLEADKLMFEYSRQVQAVAAQGREEDRLWQDYKSSNPKVFEFLPEDMAKKYIFSEYREALYKSDNPFGLIDSILKPKVSKFLSEPGVQKEAPAAVAGAGSAAASKAATSVGAQASTTQDKKPGAWDAMLDELGFK